MLISKDLDASRPRGGAIFGLMALAACCVAWPAFGARHAGPFAPFAGDWRGSGRVESSDGRSEPINCRARYDIAEGGTKLFQSLVCASDSYRFDIQCKVAAEGENVTGDWQETTRNVGGPLRGRVGDGDFEGSVDGPGFTATVSLRSNGRKQAVKIQPQAQSISAVIVTLRRED
jgi:hypothetical protein